MLDTNDTMDLMRAFVSGSDAARSVAEGGEPDLAKLERYALAMQALRAGVEDGTMWFGWVRPTRDEVETAFRLVELVRSGAPREALKEPAWQVYRAVADPAGFYSMGGTLLWLTGEECEEEPSPEDVRSCLDLGLGSFERGGTVAGFTPTAEDVARLRRLREIATSDDPGVQEERRRLAAELWARYPQDDVSAGIRRMTLVDSQEG